MLAAVELLLAGLEIGAAFLVFARHESGFAAWIEIQTRLPMNLELKTGLLYRDTPNLGHVIKCAHDVFAHAEIARCANWNEIWIRVRAANSETNNVLPMP